MSQKNNEYVRVLSICMKKSRRKKIQILKIKFVLHSIYYLVIHSLKLHNSDEYVYIYTTYCEINKRSSQHTEQKGDNFKSREHCAELESCQASSVEKTEWKFHPGKNIKANFHSSKWKSLDLKTIEKIDPVFQIHIILDANYCLVWFSFILSFSPKFVTKLIFVSELK